MASADPANPAVIRTVRLACGPASRVTGASSIPGSGMKVFHMTLMPCGAFIASVVSAGRWKCATAEGCHGQHAAPRPRPCERGRGGQRHGHGRCGHGTRLATCPCVHLAVYTVVRIQLNAAAACDVRNRKDFIQLTLNVIS